MTFPSSTAAASAAISLRRQLPIALIKLLFNTYHFQFGYVFFQGEVSYQWRPVISTAREQPLPPALESIIKPINGKKGFFLDELSPYWASILPKIASSYPGHAAAGESLQLSAGNQQLGQLIQAYSGAPIVSSRLLELCKQDLTKAKSLIVFNIESLSPGNRGIRLSNYDAENRNLPSIPANPDTLPFLDLFAALSSNPDNAICAVTATHGDYEFLMATLTALLKSKFPEPMVNTILERIIVCVTPAQVADDQAAVSVSYLNNMANITKMLEVQQVNVNQVIYITPDSDQIKGFLADTSDNHRRFVKLQRQGIQFSLSAPIGMQTVVSSMPGLQKDLRTLIPSLSPFLQPFTPPRSTLMRRMTAAAAVAVANMLPASPRRASSGAMPPPAPVATDEISTAHQSNPTFAASAGAPPPLPTGPKPALVGLPPVAPPIPATRVPPPTALKPPLSLAGSKPPIAPKPQLSLCSMCQQGYAVTKPSGFCTNKACTLY